MFLESHHQRHYTSRVDGFVIAQEKLCVGAFSHISYSLRNAQDQGFWRPGDLLLATSSNPKKKKKRVARFAKGKLTLTVHGSKPRENTLTKAREADFISVGINLPITLRYPRAAIKCRCSFSPGDQCGSRQVFFCPYCVYDNLKMTHAELVRRYHHMRTPCVASHFDSPGGWLQTVGWKGFRGCAAGAVAVTRIPRFVAIGAVSSDQLTSQNTVSSGNKIRLVLADSAVVPVGADRGHTQLLIQS